MCQRLLFQRQLNKLTSVFNASVLLLIMNFVITLSRQLPSGSADYFDNVMTKFMINNRTDALKTDGNLLSVVQMDVYCDRIITCTKIPHHKLKSEVSRKG